MLYGTVVVVVTLQILLFVMRLLFVIFVANGIALSCCALHFLFAICSWTNFGVHGKYLEKIKQFLSDRMPALRDRVAIV